MQSRLNTRCHLEKRYRETHSRDERDIQTKAKNNPPGNKLRRQHDDQTKFIHQKI